MGSKVDVSKMFVEIKIFKENWKVLAEPTLRYIILWRGFNFGKNRNDK